MTLRPFAWVVIAEIVATTVGSPSPAAAQGGAAIVRVEDGAPTRCIDPAQDRIWLTLRRAIVQKKGNWLKETSTVSMLVTAQMKVQDGRPVSFPLMTDANVETYSNGQVSLPIEYGFIDGLALKQGTTTYTGASIDLTIFNQQAKTTWGSALTSLAELAKKLPMPTGTVSQGVSYLMDFATSALNKDTAKVDLKDKAKSATLTLNFNKSCTGDFEKLGTLAIVEEPPIGTPMPTDAVHIADIPNYCWTAQLTPAFVLKAAKKEAAFACTNSGHYASAYRPVTNNYVAMVLNAVKNGTDLGPSGSDAKVARQRCIANGIDTAACLRTQ